MVLQRLTENHNQQHQTCQHLTLKRSCCKRKAKVERNGRALCTQHANIVKMTDTCCICLDPMAPHTSIELDLCKHCMHTKCIRRWVRTPPCNTTCPMCRSNLSTRDMSMIYSDYANRLLSYISHVNPFYQQSIWAMLHDMATGLVNSITALQDAGFEQEAQEAN